MVYLGSSWSCVSSVVVYTASKSYIASPSSFVLLGIQGHWNHTTFFYIATLPGIFVASIPNIQAPSRVGGKASAALPIHSVWK